MKKSRGTSLAALTFAVACAIAASAAAHEFPLAAEQPGAGETEAGATTRRGAAAGFGATAELAAEALAFPEAGAAAQTVAATQAGASGEAALDRLANIRITLRGNELPLGNILNQIARSAKLALVVDKDVRLNLQVSATDLDASPLDSALAIVLTPLGYSYDVDAERNFLRVFVYSSRTFRIAMPGVVQNWSTAISNSGSGAATGALGASIGLTTQTDTKGLWDEVERSMARLLGTDSTAAAAPKEGQAARPELGSFSVNRIAGFVTVRALPSVMPAIDSYFATLNAEMGRTVTIETRVMQVAINDDKAVGIDWNLAAAALGSVFVSGGSTLASSLGGSPTNNIFNGGSSASPPSLRLTGRAGDAFVRALELQGTVKVLAQPTLALANNLPSVIELAEIQAYVNQSTTTQVQGVGSTTTVQTATLSDGLIFSVMPRVLENGEVSLALAIILQDIIAISTRSFPGGFVELPHTARRSYSGVIRARLNETLVIGGLITTRKELHTSGIPFLSKIPIIGWFFGTSQYVDRKSELVLTVTPRDIQRVAAPAVPVRLEPAE